MPNQLQEVHGLEQLAYRRVNVAEATSHLRVALLQIEDHIVKEHVSEALKLLEEK